MFDLNKCFEYFKQPYKLNQLNRFATEYHVHNETVAAHSYYVSLFVLYLHNFYKFDLDKALKMALLHDLPESFIGDFPFHIKEQNPSLQEGFDALDSKYIDYYQTGLYDKSREYIDEFNEKQTPEALIANFADMLSSCLFCETEAALSNTFFGYKLEQKRDRCNKYIEKLKEYAYEA